MAFEILYKNSDEITDGDLVYYESQVLDLSEKSEFEINYYIDSEALNPKIEEFINSEEIAPDLLTIAEELNNTRGFSGNELTLKARFDGMVDSKKRKVFRGLREKIRRILCDVIANLQGIDTKEIIKGILIAMIPVFSGGIAAILLPIVVGLVAYFLKFGKSKTCPI